MTTVLICKDVFRIIPQFKLGIIHYHDIVVDRSPQMLRGRLAFFAENLKFELETSTPAQDRNIKEWRQVIKTLGSDPSKYRHSAEALLRRVKKGQSIPNVNSAVDITNFFSLQYRIPFGIYDHHALSGPIIVRIGTDKDSYEALNGRIYNFKNKLLANDEQGPFGSPFVDSVRTKVTGITTESLQIIYLCPSTNFTDADAMLTAIANMFTQIHGGEAKIQLLHKQ